MDTGSRRFRRSNEGSPHLPFLAVRSHEHFGCFRIVDDLLLFGIPLDRVSRQSREVCQLARFLRYHPVIACQGSYPRKDIINQARTQVTALGGWPTILGRLTGNGRANGPYPENLWLSTTCHPFAAVPAFPAKVKFRLPSHPSKSRIAVKSELSNTERTDTYGEPRMAAWPRCPAAPSNSPCRPRGRVPPEAFRDCLRRRRPTRAGNDLRCGGWGDAEPSWADGVPETVVF